MIHEYLRDGRSVFYKSSGTSMWPLVHPHDGCTFHPIQAVTAMDGRHAVNKEASEIGVGDIVFCQVQRSQQYYSHLVLSIEHDYHAKEPKYWIGNISQRFNGWCFREHIWKTSQDTPLPLPLVAFSVFESPISVRLVSY